MPLHGRYTYEQERENAEGAIYLSLNDLRRIGAWDREDAERVKHMSLNDLRRIGVKRQVFVPFLCCSMPLRKIKRRASITQSGPYTCL